MKKTLVEIMDDYGFVSNADMEETMVESAIENFKRRRGIHTKNKQEIYLKIFRLLAKQLEFKKGIQEVDKITFAYNGQKIPDWISREITIKINPSTLKSEFIFVATGVSLEMTEIYMREIQMNYIEEMQDFFKKERLEELFSTEGTDYRLHIDAVLERFYDWMFEKGFLEDFKQELIRYFDQKW